MLFSFQCLLVAAFIGPRGVEVWKLMPLGGARFRNPGASFRGGAACRSASFGAFTAPYGIRGTRTLHSAAAQPASKSSSQGQICQTPFWPGRVFPFASFFPSIPTEPPPRLPSSNDCGWRRRVASAQRIEHHRDCDKVDPSRLPTAGPRSTHPDAAMAVGRSSRRWKQLPIFVAAVALAWTAPALAAANKAAGDYFIHSLPGAPPGPLLKMHAG